MLYRLLRGRGRRRRPAGRRLQQPALHRQRPEPAADRVADGARQRDRAQAVERRPRTARRGAAARRRTAAARSAPASTASSTPRSASARAGIFSTAAAIVPVADGRASTTSRRPAITPARVAQHELLQPLNRFLEYDPGYVSPTKEALELMGIGCGPVRRPLPDFPDERAPRAARGARGARRARGCRVRLVTYATRRASARSTTHGLDLRRPTRATVGAVDGDASSISRCFRGDMVAFVAGGERVAGRPSRRSRTPADGQRAAVRWPTVKLLAPLVPPVILNSGQNYWDHRDEKPEVDQKEPEFFLKTPLAVIGPDEPVLYDSIVTKKLDYEVELAVVIGKPGPPHPGRAGARPRVRLHGRERHHGARPPGRAASRRAASSTPSARARTSTRRRRSAPGS